MKVFAAICAVTAVGSSARDEVPMIRDYLQVGGQYVENTAGEHVFQDQIYVEHLAPVNRTFQKYPLVMLHGAAQSATVSNVEQSTLNNALADLLELAQQTRRRPGLGILVRRAGL